MHLPAPPFGLRKGPPGRYVGLVKCFTSSRLLHQRVDWTKCVLAASAEAVEAENLFFVLGGPTSYMALSGERSAPTLRPRKHNYEALQLRASTRPHAARVKFKSLTPLTMTPKVSIG